MPRRRKNQESDDPIKGPALQYVDFLFDFNILSCIEESSAVRLSGALGLTARSLASGRAVLCARSRPSLRDVAFLGNTVKIRI